MLQQNGKIWRCTFQISCGMITVSRSETPFVSAQNITEVTLAWRHTWYTFYTRHALQWGQFQWFRMINYCATSSWPKTFLCNWSQMTLPDTPQSLPSYLRATVWTFSMSFSSDTFLTSCSFIFIWNCNEKIGSVGLSLFYYYYNHTSVWWTSI